MNKLERFIKKYFKYPKSSKTVLDRDIILVTVFKAKATKLEVGNKVVIDRGLANIRELKGNDWIQLTVGDKDPDGKKVFVEHKCTEVYQYFVSFTEPISGKQRVHALSFSDYEYINPVKDRELVRVHITKRKYAKLIPEDVELRRRLYYFTSTKEGKNVLQKLQDDGYDLQLDTKKRLITIKKQ